MKIETQVSDAKKFVKYLKEIIQKLCERNVFFEAI